MAIYINGQKYERKTAKKDDVDELNEPHRAGTTMHGGEVEVVEQSEVGEALRQLNDDSVQPKTQMSGIDMRSRLHASEVPSILAVDALVGFNFLPSRCLSITRQKKRLAVSVAGKGREEIVDIVGRKQEQEVKGGGIVEAFKQKFGKKDKPQ